MVHGERAALTLDGSEVVVAYVVETTRGGLVVNGSTGCDGYEPELLPGPP